MKQKMKSNSGFTLIELIIAMAILAFLMTAVSSFMGTGVLNFKKSKADINVHNTAQDVYDQLADSIMSGKNIIICAYVVSGTLDGTTAADTKVTFLEAGDAANQTLEGPYYFLRNEDKDDDHIIDQQNDLTNGYLKKYCLDVKGYKTYDELPAGVRLYPVQIIVDKAIAIDKSCCSDLKLGEENVNALTGESVVIERQMREVLNEAGNTTEEKVETSDGIPVYNVNDTERCVYTFDEKNMYLEREYAFMDKLNDFSSSRAISTLKSYKYSDAFNYVTMSFTMPDGSTQEATAPGCVLYVDEGKNALGLELYFSDKNMTYVTSGLINTRNTYVLRAKK